MYTPQYMSGKLYHRVKRERSGTWTWVACDYENEEGCYYCSKQKLQITRSDES